jgi:hypothetical protein
MTITPTTTNPAAPVAPDSARDSAGASARAEENATARQVRLLERLAEAGMGLARVAGVRATAPAGADESAEIGERIDAFAKVARAVRQTIGLEVKLRADGLAHDGGPAAAAATRRQLLLLKELAEISLAVAEVPANRVAVPIFLRVARAVRQTIGIAANLRNGRQAPDKAAGPTPSPTPEPASDPAEREAPEDPLAGMGDIASCLAETLDAFDEYYRFLRVPVARAVALIFEALGVPVEPGPVRTEDSVAPPASPAAAPGDGAARAGEYERAQVRPDPSPSERPGAGNRGPP